MSVECVLMTQWWSFSAESPTEQLVVLSSPPSLLRVRGLGGGELRPLQRVTQGRLLVVGSRAHVVDRAGTPGHL